MYNIMYCMYFKGERGYRLFLHITYFEYQGIVRTKTT
jgi:hypothetical protein